MEEIKYYWNEIQRFESDRNSTPIAKLNSLLAAPHAGGILSEKIWDW